MRRLRDRQEQPVSLIDSPLSGGERLLKGAVFSFLLHIVLIVFLILYLKPGTTEGISTVYRVTVQHFSYPLFLPENQTKKENRSFMEEIKQREPVKEIKRLPWPHEEEKTIKEPLLLQIALNTESNLEKEDNLISLPPLSPEEKYENTMRALGVGVEPVIEPGGSGGGQDKEPEGDRPGGLGEGFGGGQESYGWPSSGKESGTGRGGPSLRGSGKGTGTQKRGYWPGSKDGKIGVPFPRYAQNPKPIYPSEARDKGFEGEVLLRVEVLSNGRVGQIGVKKSCGYDILDRSALTTVKQWRFIPARKGEVPIPFWVNIPIKFQLL